MSIKNNYANLEQVLPWTMVWLLPLLPEIVITKKIIVTFSVSLYILILLQ